MSVAAPRLLLLGGVRSGKSRRAAAWAAYLGGVVTLIATAEPIDAEIRARIDAHQRERPADWRTIEAPRRLAEAIDRHDRGSGPLVIDCLTLWLTNLLVGGDDVALEAEVQALLTLLAKGDRRMVMVANECGLGLVGATPLARRFVDIAGLLQQRIAACCDRVELMVAGLPLVLKGAELESPQ
jgi:adenosylcobinamide kinase / adenosylcobinamide-phosphate guanylyltransferase